MRLLLVLTAAVVVVRPAQQAANPVYQFYNPSGRSFVYGHGYPQYQVQRDANVPGALTYLSVYGQPTFLSHPMFGLGTYVQRPLTPVVGHESVPANVPVVPPPQYTARSEKDRARASLSPLLKLAVDAGFVQESGFSDSGSPQYEVSPFLAEDAGSVSALADRLGAGLVAARHDAQMPPNTIVPDDSFSPLLIHQDVPEASKYILEVPLQ